MCMPCMYMTYIYAMHMYGVYIQAACMYTSDTCIGRSMRWLEEYRTSAFASALAAGSCVMKFKRCFIYDAVQGFLCPEKPEANRQFAKASECFKRCSGKVCGQKQP